MLLVSNDLPGGGWKQRGERTWRTGIETDRDYARRARAIKSITAWRSFENRDASMWVWCEAIPLASEPDAQAALDDVPARMLRNLQAEVEVVASRDVEPPSLPRAQRVWAREQHTSGERGDGLALMLAAAVGSVVGVIACSCFGASWTWDDTAALANRQTARIARSLVR
jgi:hypothetical protein